MTDVVGLGKALEPFSQGSVGLLRRLFGPAATEIGEAFADKIRSYRKDNLSKIFEKAEIKIGKSEFEELPLRFSIPFTEKASLEDDDALAEMWANLLTSAAINFHPEHVSFINILARLSPAEVKLLDKLIPNSVSSENTEDHDHVIFKTQVDGARDLIPSFAGIISKASLKDDGISEEGISIANFIVNREYSNMIVESLRAEALDIDNHRSWMVFNKSAKHYMVSIDLLQAEGLVSRNSLFKSTTQVSISASVVTATALGWMFAQSCRSKVDDK